jgi:ADP-ribosylation factor-like protein 8
MAWAWLNGLLNWLRSLLFAREMEISVVGLQNAGKTSLVAALAGAPFAADQLPTVGFNMRKLQRGGVTIKVWDLGGQARFRSMWARYCQGVQAAVFVVDAADHDAVDAARAELHDLLARPALAGVPLLVLGNKADLPEALPAAELIARLDLRALPGREVCLYAVSAKRATNIDVCLSWLVQHAK